MSNANALLPAGEFIAPKFDANVYTNAIPKNVKLIGEAPVKIENDRAVLIKDVARSRTVLMVEHNLSVVADLSQTITVLTRGRVLAEGDYATVSSNAEVVEAYMGTGHA